VAGRSVPIVLIPRFTTFLGMGNYDSEPIPVAEYAAAVITVWRGFLIGTSPGFAVHFFEANDNTLWAPCPGSSGDPGTNIEAVFTATLSKAWMFVRVVLAGTGAGATCWAEGFMELRER
jgi:hypothetical protein